MNLSLRSTAVHRAIAMFFSLFALILSPQVVHAEELTEQAKIEALIQAVESMNDATFVRNGSEYNAKNAAKFLRGKWDAQRKEVLTANDFIDKVATRSSTTGKPYLIRPKGAAETPCADYLKARLKTIEAAAKP
jgi:hypothetical protein